VMDSPDPTAYVACVGVNGLGRESGATEIPGPCARELVRA
jgi:hypothetical protein